MSNPRYPEEFKIQAVNQVTEKKLPVLDLRRCLQTRGATKVKPLLLHWCKSSVLSG